MLFPTLPSVLSRASCSSCRTTIAVSRSLTFRMNSIRFRIYSSGYGKVRDNGTMSEYCGILLLCSLQLVTVVSELKSDDGDDDDDDDNDDDFLLFNNKFSEDFGEDFLPLPLVI